MRKYGRYLFLLILFLNFTTRICSAGIYKSGYDNDPGFAGPSETGSLLAEDDKSKVPALRFPAIDSALKPWFEWKGELKKYYGVELGVAYTALFQSASESLPGGDDEASSGILRLSTRWTLLNNKASDTGTLVASVDQRHAYSDTAPGTFGFAGNYGVSGVPFADVDDVLVDLNWQQYFDSRSTGLVIGRYDPNDFFDFLGYSIPWTSFQNLTILNNASISLPDYSTGVGVGQWFGQQWYAKAGFNDVNGVITESDFEFDIDKLHKAAEIGWTKARDQVYFQKVHIHYWHADEKDDGAGEESEGVTIGANWTWGIRWMIFGKAGWSDGSAPLFNETYTIGLLHHFAKRTDLFGLAVNWGDPPKDSGLDAQTTTEVFYRLQLAQNLAVTPSFQYIADPGLNPGEDSITILGLRLRLTL